MKYNIVNLLLSLSGMLLSTIAQGATILGNTADADIEAAGYLTNGSQTLLAGNYYAAPSSRTATVFVFQLPTLSPGQSFSGVTLHVTYSGSNFSGGAFNADLVGLDRVASSPTVVPPDYDDPSTTLNLNFLTPSTATGAVVSNDITGWLNTQYAGGANGGRFVFLRIDTPGNPATQDNNGYTLAAAENATAGNRPFLNYSAVPEPSVALLGGLGMLGLMRRRR